MCMCLRGSVGERLIARFCGYAHWRRHYDKKREKML